MTLHVFSRTIRYKIILKRSELSREHENYDYCTEPEDDEIEPINDIKTFKHDLCTICLERIPNVLFCLCGHICICEECNKIHKYHKCPVCKTDNILRII